MLSLDRYKTQSNKADRVSLGFSAGVARVVRDDEAGGSNPLTLTNYLLNSSNIWLYLLMLWLKRSASVPISRSQQKPPSNLGGGFCLPEIVVTRLGVEVRTY